MAQQSPIKIWYESRKRYSGGFPAKGTMAGALVVLERLKKIPNLNIAAHTARGRSQIRGTSGRAVMKILESFRETRPFVSEGGRTNRGLRGDIVDLLEALKPMGLEKLSEKKRAAALQQAQKFIVDRIKDWHNQQRIKIIFEARHTMRHLVRQILDHAREKGQSGQVAQYLVGAKLALRFPELEIPNESYSTADQQLGRAGDFRIEDTAFHVTMMPMDKVYERCQQNVDEGLRAYLLVPDEHVQSARTIAADRIEGRVAVEAIESFVAQNIDEIAAFSQRGLEATICELLKIYNTRVDATEIDKSLMIEIPQNLHPGTE